MTTQHTLDGNKNGGKRVPNKFTPGRLNVAVEIFDNDGVPETAVQGLDAAATVAVALDFGANNPGMREANARRLVACWNACEMVSTEDLEALTRPGDVSRARTIDRVVRERNELLAALRLARGALRRAATDVSDWGACAPAYFQTKHRLADGVQAYNNAADSAHAAIAKAEGGAE